MVSTKDTASDASDFPLGLAVTADDLFASLLAPDFSLGILKTCGCPVISLSNHPKKGTTSNKDIQIGFLSSQKGYELKERDPVDFSFRVTASTFSVAALRLFLRLLLGCQHALFSLGAVVVLAVPCPWNPVETCSYILFRSKVPTYLESTPKVFPVLPGLLNNHNLIFPLCMTPATRPTRLDPPK